MPPTTRRTVSEPSTPPPTQYLQFSLFGPSHMPISPRPRRVHSASSSPYPTSRQAIDDARTSTRNADSSRRVLGELDWWVRMSGQREEEEDEDDYDEDEEEEEEWETMQEEEAQDEEATTPSASVDIISHNDNDDDDTISESSESEETVHSDASTLSGYDYEIPGYQQGYPQRSSLLYFPTNFPPLANLLSSQVGSEPSRRASRANANRANANRAPTSTLAWDYSTSSMMITSVPPPSPPPPPGRTTICRSSARRASSVAPGSVADNITRDALAIPSSSTSKIPGKPPIDFLPLKKFPMALFMTSPSILTFR